MFIRANPDSHGVVIEALSHGRRRRRTENERSHSQLVTGNVHANLRRMWTLGNLVLSHIVNAFASDEGLSSGLTPDHFRLHMSNSMSTTSLLMRSSLHKSVTSLNVVSSSVIEYTSLQVQGTEVWMPVVTAYWTSPAVPLRSHLAEELLLSDDNTLLDCLLGVFARIVCVFAILGKVGSTHMLREPNWLVKYFLKSHINSIPSCL